MNIKERCKKETKRLPMQLLERLLIEKKLTFEAYEPSPAGPLAVITGETGVFEGYVERDGTVILCDSIRKHQTVDTRPAPLPMGVEKAEGPVGG
jgi:hypothetical protein